MEGVVTMILGDKSKELEVLMPVVENVETQDKQKPQIPNPSGDAERQAYFQGNGIRRGYDIEVESAN